MRSGGQPWRERPWVSQFVSGLEREARQLDAQRRAAVARATLGQPVRIRAGREARQLDAQRRAAVARATLGQPVRIRAGREARQLDAQRRAAVAERPWVSHFVSGLDAKLGNWMRSGGQPCESDLGSANLRRTF